MPSVTEILAILAPYHLAILGGATAMSFLDYVTTTILVRRFGVDGEGNPVVRFVLRRFGLPGMWMMWTLVWGLAWIVWHPGLRTSLIFLCFFAGHVLNNLIVLWRSGIQDEGIEA